MEAAIKLSQLKRFGQHHRQLAPAGIAAKLAQDFETVGFGHHYIKDQGAGLVIPDALQGCVAVAAHNNIIAFVGQGMREHVREFALIINDDDPCAAWLSIDGHTGLQALPTRGCTAVRCGKMNGAQRRDEPLS
jgi:hypothetical protein